jgi:hypothetical protein
MSGKNVARFRVPKRPSTDVELTTSAVVMELGRLLLNLQ